MDENEYVEDIEFVYRRIHPRFYDLALSIPVQRDAFRPTDKDSTGLSVFRARLARPVDALPIFDYAKAMSYYVARLSVSDLHGLGLTVVPEPTPGGPSGDAVIPELSWRAYQKWKKRHKEILLELAKLASADIVLRPGTH